MARLLLLLLLLVGTLASVGQNAGSFTVRGRVLDAETKEPLAGVTVIVRQTRAGAITDFDGNFVLKGLEYGKYSLDLSYIGYLTTEVPIDLQDRIEVNLGELELALSDVGVEEVQIIASLADGRSPVATTTVSAAEIRERTAPSLDFPELVRFSPSVYVSRAGGGFGDSRISIRGFDQENLAVMLNGVPVNDMEFGNIFWVNWSGLDAVTRTIQIQRGLGVSKLAVNSIGGTMNIITKTTDQAAGGRVSFETTSAMTDASNDNSLSPYLYRMGILLSTGLLEDGWAFTFQGYRVSGDGYFEEQFVDFWSYFFSLSKQLGADHQLVFTAMGAPQSHGENLAPQFASTWEERGYRYNPNWGRDENGEVQSYGNFYHRPQLSVNHYWAINPRTTLITSAYYAPGTGGGNFIPFGPRTADGQWDVATMQAINRSNADTTLTPSNGPTVTGRPASFWATNFRLDQFQVGAISTFDYRPGGPFEYVFGVDLRYFEGDQFFDVDNLFGADFLIDGSDRSYPVRVVRVEEQRIFQSKLSQIGWVGVFGQVEYTQDRLKAFFSANFVQNRYRRQDRFIYADADSNVSPWTTYDNFSVKGGLKYSVTDEHAVFANAGYFTRAPFFGVVFGNDNVADPIPNEQVRSFEIGYELSARNLRGSINLYYTDYSNLSLNIERFTNPSDGLEYAALINSIERRHAGIEGEVNWFPTPWFGLGSFFSFGDWVITGDAEGTLLNFQRQVVGQSTLYWNDQYVGNSAQSTVGGEIGFRYADRLSLKLSGIYYGKLYSEVGQRFDPNDTERALKLPSYYLVDLLVNYNFPITDKLKGEFKLGVNNLLDRLTFTEGFDGQTHDWSDTGLFVTQGRTISLTLAVSW